MAIILVQVQLLRAILENLKQELFFNLFICTQKLMKNYLVTEKNDRMS